MPNEKVPTKIAASILSADFSCLREEIEAVERAGVDLIHLDVMDGSFVPNISFGPLVVEAVNRLTRLPLIVHLMIQRPDLYAEVFVRSGADLIVIHYEAQASPEKTLKLIRNLNCQVGISVNPTTPVTILEPFYGRLDQILLMSVNPGFGGQKFIDSVFSKISKLRSSLEKQGMKNVEIAVDGGINPANARKVLESGAHILVAGAAIFRSGDYDRAVQLLRKGEEEETCSSS
jgi:ribulose-phosphate 3-epimerase